MKNNIDISIVIVSYNTKDILRGCLLSLKKSISQKIAVEILVVDNASSDGSAAMVEKEFPKVTLISNQENLGFSKANNLGVNQASGKYLLFLNPDTVVYSQVIEKMLGFMEEKNDAGAATCFVKLPSGELDDAAHRGFPTPWNAFCHFSGLGKLFPQSRFFNGYHLGWCELDKTHEINVLAGAFMLVRREAGEQVDWWDEDYFFYGEDVDFCYMLNKKGWKIYFVPTVSILHLKGVSGGIKDVSQHVTTADKETKKRATLARFNAMKIFYKKHYLDKYPPFITWLIFQGINMKLWYTLKRL